MPAESDFVDLLRALAGHPAARGLLDDAAVLEIGGRTLVLTHDMLVEGVHYLPDDPPGDVAWKLVAVNLSDLGAKGARPLGALLGYTLAGDTAWDAAFVEGLYTALAAFEIPLLGGDTVSAGAAGPRVLALTAIGEAHGPAPSRSGAAAGDHLWVTGTIGDAGAGLRALRGELPPDPALVESYRTPRTRVEIGPDLAPLVTAMMDVSDGLLIDSARLARASGVAIEIELEAIPLSAALVRTLGDSRDSRLGAATAGDDYELLFTASPGRGIELLDIADRSGIPVNRIGVVGRGAGLHLTEGGRPVPLPPRLGWEHR
ncbi:MAG TPA: thiamine-phosphate kinase [Allosphingosinicella sp.]|nr:thiamine-phosphate kinase [Allosphingosinicella sp.]